MGCLLHDVTARCAAIETGPMPQEPIVEEELALLTQVNARLGAGVGTPPPSEFALIDELEHLRTALREGTKTEDRAALVQQWDRQSALLQHIRNAP